MQLFEHLFNIKNKKKRIRIKTKGIKLRQIKTKNNSLRLRFYNGQDFEQRIKFRKKVKAKDKPLGVFFKTKKLGISIHNSERFQKRQRKKRALLDSKRRKKPKVTPTQKSKIKKAAKLKKKLRKLKYK